jgi:hypothetical protein
LSQLERGEVGPIEAKLLELGERDGFKPHAAVGFVLSAFGELFSTCCSLYTAIARVSAACVLSFWKMPPKHALALCKQKNLRFWSYGAMRLGSSLQTPGVAPPTPLASAGG